MDVKKESAMPHTFASSSFKHLMLVPLTISQIFRSHLTSLMQIGVLRSVFVMFNFSEQIPSSSAGRH